MILEARILVIPPPPIQGIGNAAGFAMQVQLRDGNADYGKLQAITGAIVSNAQTQSALQRVSSSFRSMVPQFDVEVDRIKTQTLHVTTDQIFRRCRPIWARPSSISSTSSAAPSRSMPRRMRNSA